MPTSAKGTGKTRKVLGALVFIFVLLGLYWGLLHAPTHPVQLDIQRIMYLHIPSILTAYLAFFIVFVGSCLYLWKGERRDDILANSAAEIGVLLTAVTIITGILWGKKTWFSPGDWWTWDARLTLTALLLLIFVGYLMLRALIEDERRGAVCGAVLGIIGFLDIPLIHMAVHWFQTLHQAPSILQTEKAPWENIPPDWLVPLSINFIAFILLFFYLLSLRLHVGEIEEEIKKLKLYGRA